MGDPLHGVNTHWTESVLGGNYVRLTDETDAPAGNPYASFSVGDGGNPGLTNAAADLFLFNTDGGLFKVKTLNLDTMQAAKTPFTFTDSVIFDSIDPDVIWEHKSSVLSRDQIDRFTIPWSLTKTKAFDFAADPKCLSGFGRITWSGTFTMSADGTAIGLGYSNSGGQETGTKVAIYFPGKGCRVLDTKTGTVTGDFGPVGPITGTALRFALHESVQTPNPDYVRMSTNNCFQPDGTTKRCTAYFVWQTSTNKLTECGTLPPSPPFCDGHAVLGFNGAANSGPLWYRLYSNINARLYALMPSHPQSDLHGSWPQSGAPPDSMPAFVFTTQVGRPQGPNTYPFENEVVGFSPDGKGVTYREGFNWNSGLSSKFSCQNAIGHVSWNGKVAILASDGEGSFGGLDGKPTCNLASGNCRCEIIGIKMR